jgi:RimJ/RimL family protein N-acetyltransferase
MNFDSSSYLFTSKRLGFRSWEFSDLDDLFELNNDERVMQYFPNVADRDKCLNFINRMQEMHALRGYCYFAVECLDKKRFIGFIGISYIDFQSSFTPCVDIGWRLLPEFWGDGFATEGARRCLIYAFDDLNISEIVAIAPTINRPSISVMHKIGMIKLNSFIHPLLIDFEKLKYCELFSCKNEKSATKI